MNNDSLRLDLLVANLRRHVISFLSRMSYRSHPDGAIKTVNAMIGATGFTLLETAKGLKSLTTSTKVPGDPRLVNDAKSKYDVTYERWTRFRDQFMDLVHRADDDDDRFMRLYQRRLRLYQSRLYQSKDILSSAIDLLESIAELELSVRIVLAVGSRHRRDAERPQMQDLKDASVLDRRRSARRTSDESITLDVYLDIDDQRVADKVFAAVDHLVDVLGYDKFGREIVERGSIVRRSWAAIRTSLSSDEAKARYIKLERAIELAAIEDRQADVDLKEAQAVKAIIESLAEVPRACIRVGSLLVLKHDGRDGPVVLSRTLSQLEVRALDHSPEMQRNPEQVLQLLAAAIVRKAEEAAPAVHLGPGHEERR